MVRSNKKFILELDAFLEKYPENQPVQLDDKFRVDVESICYLLSFVEISYTNINAESDMHHILDCASKIMMHFQKADILEPLNNTNFILYLKLSQLIGNLKCIVVSELDDDDEIEIHNYDLLFDFKKEQYICDTYKSKLDEFKKNYNEEELQTINEHFTYFFLEFLKYLSKLGGKGKLIEKHIKLLLEVADLRILVENIHCISNIISQTKKILILQKITNFCIKKNFNLKNCGFLKSFDREFKFEVCAISYFTLQHICHYLELQKMHQSSQILSSFSVEDIISTIDSVTFNPKIEKSCEDAANLITFKTCKKIKAVPSHKIKKCLNILNLLLNSLSNNQLQNCSFAIILLSMVSEFVLATDLDKPTLISLIDLVIGYLDVSKLPPNFSAVCYAFKIYQKLKTDVELEIKAIELCKSLSFNIHKHHPYIKIDVEPIKAFEDAWDDKSIIISYFLNNYLKKIEDGALKELFYTLNEYVLLSSQYSSIWNVRLIYPYSVALNFSILNKEEDCLFNNLAVLDDYLTIYFKENQTVGMEDNDLFLTVILRHYKDISQSLPDDFLLKCWNFSLNPKNVDIGISKELLLLCSSKNLSKFLDILKVTTMKIFEENEPVENDDFYLYIHKLWHSLLNMQFIKQKKKVRRDQVNHFCFILNRTFLFSKKIKNEQSLILLLRLVSSLLKLPWVNKTTLMNCSLRIITYVEKSSNQNHVQSLTEAAELLIVLYKSPNNSIKPLLGLYTTTFANLVKKCWLFICSMRKMKEYKKNLIIPLHKLEKCSGLFKQNKSDFEIICRYIIEDLIELVSIKNNLRDGFMRHYYNIIFNLMDVCSSDEIKQLMLNITGPSLLILRNAYKEYRSSVRFTGRL